MTEDRYFLPNSLAEASELLLNDGSLLVAGGTSLKFRRTREDTVFVDISRVAPSTITIGPEEIVLGSMVRIRDLLCNPELGRLNYGILHQTALHIATTPVRNQVTVGGNITMLYPWSDLPVSLLALDSRMVTCSGDGEKEYRAEEWFGGQPERKLGPGEILTEVRMPIYEREHIFRFSTLNRTEGDFAAINLAVGFGRSNGFQRVRIAVSGVTSLPVRLTGLEEELEGSVYDRHRIDEIVVKHIEGIKPRDFRYGKDYLRKVLKVMIVRALTENGGGR